MSAVVYNHFCSSLPRNRCFGFRSPVAALAAGSLLHLLFASSIIMFLDRAPGMAMVVVPSLVPSVSPSASLPRSVSFCDACALVTYYSFAAVVVHLPIFSPPFWGESVAGVFLLLCVLLFSLRIHCHCFYRCHQCVLPFFYLLQRRHHTSADSRQDDVEVCVSRTLRITHRHPHPFTYRPVVCLSYAFVVCDRFAVAFHDSDGYLLLLLLMIPFSLRSPSAIVAFIIIHDMF